MAASTARCDLPVCAHTVRDARAFALVTARAWHNRACPESLLLVLDELIRAVLAHAGFEDDLVLELSAHEADALVVCLADHTAVVPVVRDIEAEHARTAIEAVGPGSLLVSLLAGLARRWGHERHHDGHRVWFEIAAVPDGDDEPVTGAQERALAARLGRAAAL